MYSPIDVWLFVRSYDFMIWRYNLIVTIWKEYASQEIIKEHIFKIYIGIWYIRLVFPIALHRVSTLKGL